MRKIKFRAWDTKEKVMVPLDRKWICTEYSSLAFESSQDEYRGICQWPKGDEEEQVIMQFTGLTDKAGKEIYEGDILKPVNPPSRKKHNRVVEFVEGSFCYDHGATRGKDKYWQLTQGKTNLFEVIGDIYSNPELISSDRK